MSEIIHPGARAALAKQRIREIQKELTAEYKPLIKDAKTRAEKKRLKDELAEKVQAQVEREGLTEDDLDGQVIE